MRERHVWAKSSLKCKKFWVLRVKASFTYGANHKIITVSDLVILSHDDG